MSATAANKGETNRLEKLQKQIEQLPSERFRKRAFVRSCSERPPLLPRQ